MAGFEILDIASIGHCAAEILQNDQDAAIIGVTSTGIFIRTTTDNILYLTADPHCGPLTINIPAITSHLKSLAVETQVKLSPRVISLEEFQLKLQMGAETTVWEPPDLRQTPLDLAPFKDRVEMIKPDIFEDKFQIDFELGQGFRSNRVAYILEKLTPLIGCGEGLTPSGDDFICGILLALYTWEKLLFPKFPREALSAQICDLAQRKTTALSANLIACAARGSADERIFNCLAWLHIGFGNYVNILKELQSYGSSSGFDTMQGIITALSLSPAFSTY